MGAIVSIAVQRDRNSLPMQPGNVPSTFADVSLIASSVGYRPQVPVRDGVARFVQWYREFADRSAPTPLAPAYP